MNFHAHYMTRDQVVALLEERDTLRETVRQLEDMLRPTVVLPPRWHLSQKEADLLRALRAVGPNVLHRERAIIALYGTWEDAPDQKIVDVWLCKLRRKLRDAKSGILIESVWGRGWRLRPDECALYDAAVAEVSAGYPATGAAQAMAGAAHHAG